MQSKLPHWFKKQIPNNPIYSYVSNTLKKLNLNTVCKEAKCPNVGECYSCGRATFMILGDVCTRQCVFCGINKGTPKPIDSDEPERIKQAVEKLGLKYVVITSVTRDDLHDGGASIFAEVVKTVRNGHVRKTVGDGLFRPGRQKDISSVPQPPQCKIEILTPDFLGNESSLKTIANAAPDVFNHNIETVPSLYATVRPQADYKRSLYVLKKVKDFNCSVITKSGIMLGLGEKKQEVFQLFRDLRAVECDILTIGQYLKPAESAIDVVRYVRPEEFDEYRDIGLEMGFKNVFSGPLVRSSYHAEEVFNE